MVNDGTLKFDTSIDTSGFEKGTIILSDLASNAAKNIEDSFSYIGQSAKDALPDMMNFLKEVASGYDSIKKNAKLIKDVSDFIGKAKDSYALFADGVSVAESIQTAFNTSLAAGPFALLVAGVSAATLGIIAYKSATQESLTPAQELIQKDKELIEKSHDLCKEMGDLNAIRDAENSDMVIEAGSAKILADRLYELQDKAHLTNLEKQEMVSLVDQLNEKIPNLGLKIDAETGKLSLQKDQVYKLIDAQIELYKVKAAEETLIETAKKIYKAETTKNELIEDRKKLEKELQDAIKARDKKQRELAGSDQKLAQGGIALYNAIKPYQDRVNILTGQLDANKLAIDAQSEAIKNGEKAFKDASVYIAEHEQRAAELETTTQRVGSSTALAYTGMVTEAQKYESETKSAALGVTKVLKDSETGLVSFKKTTKDSFGEASQASKDMLDGIDWSVSSIMAVYNGMATGIQESSNTAQTSADNWASATEDASERSQVATQTAMFAYNDMATGIQEDSVTTKDAINGTIETVGNGALVIEDFAGRTEVATQTAMFAYNDLVGGIDYSVSSIMAAYNGMGTGAQENAAKTSEALGLASSATGEASSVAQRYLANIADETLNMVNNMSAAIIPGMHNFQATIDNAMTVTYTITKTKFHDMVQEGKFAAQDMVEVGQAMGNGIASGLQNRSGFLMETIRSIVLQMVAEAKRAADVNSPSKEMARKVGAPLAEGIGYGFVKAMPTATRLSTEQIGTFVDRMQQAVDVETTRYSASVGTRSAPYHLNEGISQPGQINVNVYPQGGMESTADIRRLSWELGQETAKEFRRRGLVSL